MSDGREVWVSVPKPDRIVLIASLKYEHFLPKPKNDTEFEEYIIALSQSLATGGGQTTLGETGFQQSNGLFHEVVLHAGDREATTFIKFTKPKKGVNPTAWKLRIEFNPRKLGVIGHKQLALDLSYEKTFRLARFLADARLTRLDVAVDVVGVEVWETVPSVTKSGKTTYYVGSDGSLETIILHRLVPAPKLKYDADGMQKKVMRNPNPLGVTLAKLYNRRAERAAVLQPAPFGAAPVTRIEIVKTWKGNGPHLVKLTALSDPFSILAVAYVNHMPPGPLARWLAYVTARRMQNSPAAAKIAGLTVPQSLAMSQAYNSPASSLLRHQDVWPLWAEGIASTGLHNWIAIGEAGSSDTFEGGQN